MEALSGRNSKWLWVCFCKGNPPSWCPCKINHQPNMGTPPNKNTKRKGTQTDPPSFGLGFRLPPEKARQCRIRGRQRGRAGATAGKHSRAWVKSGKKCPTISHHLKLAWETIVVGIYRGVIRNQGFLAGGEMDPSHCFFFWIWDMGKRHLGRYAIAARRKSKCVRSEQVVVHYILTRF